MNSQYDSAEGFTFEVSVFDSSRDASAVVTERPVWSRVSDGVERVCENGGYIKLRIVSPQESFIRSLNLSALPGRFRLEVQNRAREHRERIYEWWEPGDAFFRGVVSFGDDEWDARTVCSDVSVAKAAFSELFQTGELRVTLLSMRSWWNPKPRDISE